MGEAAKASPNRRYKRKIGGNEKMKTKFEYGEVYDCAPTYGIDLPKGKYQILGILNYQILPRWLDDNSWRTMDPDFDSELENRPWYRVFDIDNDDDDEIILPEFALEEVIHRANIQKIEKWRNSRLME